MKLTKEQREFIIKGLEENLNHYKNLEVHKKEHKEGKCLICEEYKKIINELKKGDK